MNRIDPSCSRCLDGFACREHQSDERIAYLRAGPVSPTGVTPGSWTWFATPHGARVHVGHEVRVADVLSGSNAPTQEGCEANARLIAAAPDLFDALHSLLSALEDVPVAFGVHVHDAIDQCDKALRKALFDSGYLQPPGDERAEALSDRRRGELGGWNEYDRLRTERDVAGLRAEAAEKQLRAIAMLVSIYERQRENEPDEGWPEGDLHPRQVLLAIAETIGNECSICRSRHGSEVQHACE